MTVFATACITRCAIDPVNHPGNYVISYQYDVTAGSPPDNLNTGMAIVSDTLSPKRADQFVRQTIANDILTTFGFTIDPNDIYIPFSG